MTDSMDRLNARLDELLAQPEPTTPAEYMNVIEQVLTEFNAAFAQDEQERAERKQKEDEERPLRLEKKLEELSTTMRQATFDIERLRSTFKHFQEMSKMEHEITGLKVQNALLREIDKLQAQITAQEKRIKALETPQ